MAAIEAVRDLRVNNVPMSQVSTALNLQPLRVERSRNPKPLVLYFDASPLAAKLRAIGIDPEQM